MVFFEDFFDSAGEFRYYVRAVGQRTRRVPWWGALASVPVRPHDMKTQTATRKAKAPGPPAGAPGPCALSITVLHVDDDPNDAALLRAAAVKAKSPFLIQNVEDAEQAMAYLNGLGEYADRHRYALPALVLLDLKMPRTTGLEVLQWMRAHPQWAQIPVVVLSGSELHDDIQRAYSAGANSYLVKPLGFEALVTMIRNLSASWLANVFAASNTARVAELPGAVLP